MLTDVCTHTYTYTYTRTHTNTHTCTCTYAMQIMKQQMGIVNFAPYKDVFLAQYARSRDVVPATTCTPPLFFHIHRNWQDAGTRNGLPAIGLKFSALAESLQNAYASTTKGKFSDARSQMREILRSLPLLVVNNRSELQEVQQVCVFLRDGLKGECGGGGESKCRVQIKPHECTHTCTHTHTHALSLSLWFSLKLVGAARQDLQGVHCRLVA